MEASEAEAAAAATNKGCLLLRKTLASLCLNETVSFSMSILHPSNRRMSQPSRKLDDKLSAMWNIAVACLTCVPPPLVDKTSKVMVTLPWVCCTFEWQSWTNNF